MLQVIVVDHDKDSGLCHIDELAAEAVSNAIKSGAEACVSVSSQQLWLRVIMQGSPVLI